MSFRGHLLEKRFKQQLFPIHLPYTNALFSSRNGTVKAMLNVHSKLDQIKILMMNGGQLNVKSIAECSAILMTCIKQSLVLKTNLWSF